jgi:cellulose synthase/poly-beta-1,6-N-acetylglucosamine synthase-like glycosyltransferase
MIEWLFGVSAILLLWAFIGYPLLLLFLSKFIKKKQLKNNNTNYTPTVSIIIPTFNEEKVIEKKLKNCLELYYPKDKIEIIIVDSSMDKTPNIVEDYIQKNKNNICDITLIREHKRKGKASAINNGIKYAKGEIIIITDANAFLEKSFLMELVKHFTKENIGAIEGRYLLYTYQNYSTISEESLFRRFENWLKEKESLIDSTVGIVGELSAFRKKILTNMAFDEKMIAEDFEISIRLRKNGYKIIHEPNAVVWEYAPSNLKDEIVQKKRRAIGTIQALFKHKNVILNPKYGLYSLIILPSHKLLQVLSPILLSLFVISSFGCYIFLSKNNIFYYLIILEILFLLIGIISILSIRFKLRIRNPLFKGIGYFLLTQLIMILAWFDFFRGKYNVTWEKIESTRRS